MVDITIGRFVIPTKGHEYLFSHLPENSIILISKSWDKEKNWFSVEQKMCWIKQIRPDLKLIPMKNPFEALEKIINDYEEFKIWVGEDRKDLAIKLQKYFSNKSINIEYMPRYLDISATQVRKTLKEENYKEFLSLVNFKIARSVWETYYAFRNNRISTISVNEQISTNFKSSF